VDDLLKVLSLPSPVQQSSYLSSSNYDVFIKRDDLIHPHISGNKYRKLKYNLIEANRRRAQVLVTYGGPFSNHLVAVAAAAHFLKKKSVGIVRGYKLDEQNPTIQLLRSYNMELVLVEPQEYRLKEESSIVSSIISHYNDCYLIPEGGTNELALRGVSEGVLEISDIDSYDIIVLALGTGGTAAGVCVAVENFKSKVISVSPFKTDKGDYLGVELLNTNQRKKLKIIPSILQVRFAGYHPKITKVMKEMEELDNIQIDPVYLAKTIYTLKDLITKKELPLQSKILLIHSGGLQGASGYKYQYAGRIAKEKAMD